MKKYSLHTWIDPKQYKWLKKESLKRKLSLAGVIRALITKAQSK